MPRYALLKAFQWPSSPIETDFLQLCRLNLCALLNRFPKFSAEIAINWALKTSFGKFKTNTPGGTARHHPFLKLYVRPAHLTVASARPVKSAAGSSLPHTSGEMGRGRREWLVRGAILIRTHVACRFICQ